MKKLAALLIACGLASQSFAIGIGGFKINPEIGASVGTNTFSETMLAGGYGRVWLVLGGLSLAPVVKYNYTLGPDNLDGFSNIQAGGLLGYRIFRFTPYVGASYSNFSKNTFEDTTALNYGIFFDIPILPLSVGFDASWQQPKYKGTDIRRDQHQFAVTLGLIF